jgi:hypothetical protein
MLRYEGINVWMGVIGDQKLGPVVLYNRLTDAPHHRRFGEGFTNTLINNKTCGSCVMGHQLIFSALLDSS